MYKIYKVVSIQKEKWVSDVITCKHLVEKLFLVCLLNFLVLFNCLIQDINDTEVNMTFMSDSS